MIKQSIQNFFNDESSSIVTPYKNISMVFHENNLGHAILILKESNYNQVPVLDYNNKFMGLISIGYIFKSLSKDQFKDNEDWESLLVKDFTDQHYATCTPDTELEDVMNLLVNYNFINVIDDEGIFLGIITRSAVLKKVNHLLHNYDSFQ